VASSDVTAGPGGPDGGPAAFEQGPLFPRGVALYPLVTGAGAVVLLFVQDVAMNARGWWGLVAVVVTLFVVLAVTTLPQSMKRVRVDRDGLHVQGELALAAARIGQVQALDGRDAAGQSWRLTRRRGLKLRNRQNLYGGALGYGPAVGFEEVDDRDDRVSTWLIPTREPDALAAALEHARDDARRRR
jgi:hypothetical protein